MTFVINGNTGVIQLGGTNVTIDGVNKRILVNDGTDNRVLMGYDSGGFGSKDYGIKVSRDGYDVLTATDDQLVMSSAFNSFKIVSTGTSTLGAGSLQGAGFYEASNQIAHGLSYTPTMIVMVDGGTTGRSYTGEKNFLEWDSGNNVFNVSAQLTWYADATNLNFIYRKNASFSSGIKFKYYLCREVGA